MEGRTGVMTFGDGTKSRVKVVQVDTYSMMPSDYWLEYAEDETNRPLVHPDKGTNPLIVAEILLPEGIFNRVIELDPVS